MISFVLYLCGLNKRLSTQISIDCSDYNLIEKHENDDSPLLQGVIYPNSDRL